MWRKIGNAIIEKITINYKKNRNILPILEYNVLRKQVKGEIDMMKYVMVKQDINVWFKKDDVVEVKEVDEKYQLVKVYNRKNKKTQWLMFKDVM